jgi:iron(III) transport system substrate-binding protein
MRSNDPALRNLSRRDLLRLSGGATLGLLAIGLSACAPSSSTSSAPAAPPTTAPAAAPTSASAAAPQTAPGTVPTARASTAEWDQIVAAAQKEGKVVVSGPPSPEGRLKLPAGFKQRYGFDVEYLAGNTSQLAARVESERAAGQYTVDVSLSGPDTVYATFLKNNWLDPLKPALMLPDVVDPKVWPNGSPWFRDPGGTTMQIFNTISPLGYINTDLVSPDEIKSSDDLLDPKWKGKLATYDPGVNGGGLIWGSVLYVTRGPEFAKQFFQGQAPAYTRDYQQLADWIAHGTYPIGFGVTPQYMATYQGAVPLKQIVLSDIKTIVAGGFSIISLWNQAPHPNAAKVFANWIASKEGTSIYSQTEQAAPVRLDIDPSGWMDPDLVPKPNGDYFDVYTYQYVMEQRQPIAQFYAALKG